MTLRLAACLVLCAAAAPAFAQQRIANISQGTGMAAAMTPDGESLVVDLLGRLWLLPSSGGAARQLTPDDEAARHPRVSPDGRQVVYQRRVDGQWDLWLLDLESAARRPLTDSPYDERHPDFSPDGTSVVFVADTTGHDCLWSVSVAEGVLTQLTEEPGDAAFPSVSERGEVAYVRRDGDGWALRVLTAWGAPVELLRSPHRLSAPTWRPGGGVLLFHELQQNERGPARSELKMLVLSSEPVIKTLTRAEDVFIARPAWVSPGEYVYTADGQIWRRGIAQVTRRPVHLFAAVAVDMHEPPPFTEPLDAAGSSPAFGVTGRSFSGDGKRGLYTALGDLWLTDGRGSDRQLTNDEFVDIDAAVSPDGEFAVFASDRSGYMDLWRVALPGGLLTPLTNRPDKAFRPAIAPDGRHVAFLETSGLSDIGPAALRLLDLGSGRVTRTLAEGLIAPGRPTWEDGGHVTVRARSSGAAPNDGADQLLTIDIASGAVTRRAAASAASPVDPSTPGPAEPAAAATATWRAAASPEPYVVQVGRLFDGIRSDYRRHVDVHVEGQRITAIVGRNMLPLPGRVIDARDSTVIPGLIDVHAHHSNVLGERLGRAWLAHGVTTVRELTDDVPAALERAESWASGRRLGPRLIVSPLDATAATQAPQPRALPTPVPVRSYSGLRIASTLFGVTGAAASAPAPLPGRHGDGGAAFLLQTSPLRLSYEDVFNTLVESGTVVTSDLAAAGGDRRTGGWQKLLSHPTVQRIYSAAERDRWFAGGPAESGGLEALQSNLARLARSGGRIAAGTEAPAIPYGLGLHLELARLAEAGIPPDQVLRIATASNAMALGLERQLGTLEEGKLADFVVVEGNPLVDLPAAMDVTAVAKGGVWLDRRRLVEGS